MTTTIRSFHSTHIAAGTITIAIIALSFANIWLSAHLSHLGIRLKELQLQRDSVKKTNQSIAQTLFKQTALIDIETKSEQWGFTEKVKAYILPTTPPLASR